MVPRVSMINMKGGVAKTTLAVNIAFCAAKLYNKRVLLVDVDPQFNATQYLMKGEDYLRFIEDPKKCTMRDIFFDKADPGTSIVSKKPPSPPKPTIKNTVVNIWDGSLGRLDIIPSELRLMDLDSIPRMHERKLANFLDNIEQVYDLILIDCPPTMTVFTLSAYLASNAYLVPVKPDPLSVIGLPLLEKAIGDYAANSGHAVKSLGIVFTMVRKTKLMNETMQTLTDERGSRVFQAKLSFGTEVANSVEIHKPLVTNSRTKKFGEEIKLITEEFIGRLEAEVNG